MNAFLVVTTALLLTLTAPVGMLAQPGARVDAPGRGPRAMGAAALHERLNLTADQEKQMTRLRLEHQKKMQQVRAKLAALRLERRSLFLADSPDRQAIDTVSRAMGELTAQQEMHRVDHWFAVNAILTPAQKEIWKEMRERGPRHAPRRECGRNPRFHRGMRE